MQNTLFVGNTSCSNKTEFGLEYTNAYLENTRGKDELVKNVNLRGPSCLQSCENIDNFVVQLEEDKWEIIDVISSEDESADNGACNVALLLNNGTLQESGGNKLQDSVTSIDPDYITLPEEESLAMRIMRTVK